MASHEKKNLIIHITSPNPETLKNKLSENEHFRNYMGGSESSFTSTFKKISTRYYYYEIEHTHLGEMIRFLHLNRGAHVIRIKILKEEVGYHHFD